MKRLTLAAVCLLMFGVSCPALQNAEKKPIPVRGMVLNERGDTPIRKATIELRVMDKEGEPLQTQSDATGHFEFPDVPAGRYFVSAEHQGFFSPASRVHRSGTRIDVSEGHASEDIVLRLAPAAAIRGVISDEDGDPVSGVEVHATTKNHRTGRMSPLGAENATTDDRGEYRIHDLQPGRYYIVAASGMRAGALAMMSGKSQAKLQVPTFYPGVVDRAAASEVTLGAGDELVANFTIMTAPAVHVKGTLTGASGKPAMAGAVFVISAGQSMSGPMAQVKDGAFDLQVPQGKYTLAAMAMDEDFIASAGSRMPGMARQTIEVGPDGISNLKLSVTSSGAGKINGHIRTEGSDKLDFQKLFVMARSTKEDEDAGGPMGMDGFSMVGGYGLGKVKPDGTFEIENLAAGTYDLWVGSNATGMEQWFVKSINIGGHDATTSPIKVEGASTLSLTLTASSAGAQLEGTVVDADGQPIPNAMVVTLPDAALRWRSQLFHETATDHTGHFVMKGVEPGKYQVLAWDEIDIGAWKDKDYIKSVENAATAVDLNESDKKRVQLKAIITTPEPTKSPQ